MPRGLQRFYGSGDLHFVTFSCYRRSSFLATWSRRDMFLRALEKVACEYRVGIVGYVVMPEHVHLLLSEPERDDLSTVIKALKQFFGQRQESHRFIISGPTGTSAGCHFKIVVVG